MKARPLQAGDLTLNQVLTRLGYTTRPARREHSKDILDGAGAVVFTGVSHNTWEWLRRTKQVTW